MSSLRWLIAIPSLAALCACATTAPPVASTSHEPAATAPRGASAYGLFLAGESALNTGRGDTAAAYFGQAAAVGTPADSQFLTNRTFTAALLAGDVKGAAQFVPTGADDDVATRHLAALTRGVEAMAEGQGAKARAILTGPDVGPLHEGAAALMAPFASAMAGDPEAAIAHPVISGDPVAQFFASLDQGKLFERARRYDEAETAFRALIAGGDPGGIASLSLGELLERRGRGADALAIYDRALGRGPGDGALAIARARVLAKGPPPPLSSIRELAAEALFAPASVMMVQKQDEMALAYLRLALRLDPGRNGAWLLVGDILAEAGDIEGARAAFLTPKPGSDDYITARGKLAWTYQTNGDKPQALKIAQQTVAAAPTSREAATTLADILQADERYDESARVLDPLIAREGAQPDWRLLYMRAVDLQQSGDWAGAERDLTLALKQKPDEPELLNFLGYSWIDRGERLPQALAMVQKAVDGDPQSGAMLDSLGWGYYRLGDYKTAVEKLEAAVVIEAGDPDVNNHLGDAYWRVGRKIEARFQWNRVLTLEPTPKLRTEVEAKLKSGLDAAPGPSQVAGS